MNEERFDAAIGYAFDNDERAVVLFTAPAWCGPCKKLEPHWSLATSDPELFRLHFITVDLGQTPQEVTKHWALERFNILGVPTVMVLSKDAAPVKVDGRTIAVLKRELLTFV